ncbi:MAG: regulatory protein RecX [Rikenellaceae bacterium]
MEGITKDKALIKLTDMCSKREICPSKATELMWRWGVKANDQQEILEYLTLNRFIDPKRYALLFVREKCRLGKWGKRKIIEALRIKHISKEVITTAIEQEYKEEKETLELIIKQKMKTIKGKDSRDIANKLIRFALSRGFEYEEVKNVLEKLKVL